MSATTVEQVANAVLYEGYILYPYRPSSVKNRQRWTFGGVYPRAYSDAQTGSDAWSVQFDCLVQSAKGAAPRLDVRVRFLHLVERQVGALEPPRREVARSWQEAVERDVQATSLDLHALCSEARRIDFAFPARRDLETLCAPDGPVIGVVVREQQGVEGAIDVNAARIADDLFKLTVRVQNLTPLDPAVANSRDAALLQTLISAHAVVQVQGGEILSLLDPPPGYEQHAAACTSVGLWPVLVGAEGERHTVLASPIILYDYPQIAPESPGDLFDGTEIDEILTLRILTMTDAEKEEMRQSDARARALLERTEALSPEDLMGLHGTLRQPRLSTPSGGAP